MLRRFKEAHNKRQDQGTIEWALRGPREALTLKGVRMRIKFRPPLPTPEFLTKDFPSATMSRMKILTKENLAGARTAPTAVSRTFTPLVRGIRFP